MSKKSYTLPQNLSSGISNAIHTVQNNRGSLNYTIVPLDLIEFDPDNPRDLATTRSDIINGLKESDPQYHIKLKEIESLQQTAETIKKYGVRNAVEIYKFGTKYRLIHGERRCLSSLLAGKSDIPAKVLDQKPNDLDIRLLQLIENVQREDLSLYETLQNIRQVIVEYKKFKDPSVEINAKFLESLINKSKPHCLNYLAVLNAPAKVQELIKEGTLKNLEKAALIANTTDLKQQQELIDACLNGASLKELKLKKSVAKEVKQLPKKSKLKPGKRSSKINMGVTKSKAVVAILIQLVTSQPKYHKISDKLHEFTLDDYDSCTEAFKTLIALMEKIENS